MDHPALSGGFELLGAHASHAINVSLLKLPYDAIASFEPVSLLATVPNMLLVKPSFPGQSLGDLIAEAKRKPGRLTYTSAGIGTSGHIAGSRLATMAGVQLLLVPARGPAQAVQDALAGHVDILFDSTALSMPLVKSGRLKALAVTSPQRLPQLGGAQLHRDVGLVDELAHARPGSGLLELLTLVYEACSLANGCPATTAPHGRLLAPRPPNLGTDPSCWGPQ